MNLSPGERLAESARDEQESQPPVATSALSRVLRRNNAEPSSETEEQATSTSSTTIARGRLFSAIVDRFPSRRTSDRDPFLESEIAVDEAESQSQTADLGEASDSPVDGLSRRSLVQSSAPERTDEELWQMFANDSAGVARAGQDDPTLTANEAAPTPVDVESLPEWARPQPAEVAEHAPSNPTRTASTSAANPPIRNADNLLSKLQTEPEIEVEQSESSIAASARKGLQNLLSQSHRRPERDLPPKAGESVLEGASFAAPDHGSQVHAADIVQQIDRQPGSPRDPFGDPPTGPAAQMPAYGTSPFASGSGSSPADGAPWTTQVQPESPNNAVPPFAADRPEPATPFPTAPEWRGVRANSPVSLAVVEQPVPAIAIEDPSEVRHADIRESAAANRPGRLLPRSLPEHDPIFRSDEQTLALTVPPASEGPLLAPPAVPAPLSIAPPPAPELHLTARPVLAASDETHARTRGYGSWIIGGALLAAGMWLFGFGSRRPSRRPMANDRK